MLGKLTAFPIFPVDLGWLHVLFFGRAQGFRAEARMFVRC
jgi:hypothetical protein